MKVTHELTLKARCPVDDAVDIYEVTITTNSMSVNLKVEDLLEVVDALQDTTIFQEDITMKIADRLGVSVRTVGYHSGVKTTCEV